ncbi:kynureninase-like [Stylophora pistillata]|uniref:kynureninase-like n=1 Tax=Stylophora pistillata TaxID=50429 RepID=UPI000C05317F|nr:kynureninase-like [Stylophora pistillata]
MTSYDDLRKKCSEQLNFEPFQTLIRLAKSAELEITDAKFAHMMDDSDELKNLREEFFYPKIRDLPKVDPALVDMEMDSMYFCGNSLGLQPKESRTLVIQELDKWEKMGVHGHFCGDLPWWKIEDFVLSESARIVGAKDIEVAIMNSLTVNLHLLLVPFYRPTPQRHKILIEAKAFPSDHYAVQSQISFHGYNPAEALIEATPREGEELLRTDDIVSLIEKHGDSIALVMFSGVQYYSGQFFDIKRITASAQKKGCVVGWDLAHAVGNVELHLHDWNVDFACWCSYKYLNSGPGGIAGAFVHEKHAYNL